MKSVEFIVHDTDSDILIAPELTVSLWDKLILVLFVLLIIMLLVIGGWRDTSSFRSGGWRRACLQFLSSITSAPSLISQVTVIL